ncbi:MAG: methylamine utilization protein [Pirellula sp.]|nr:methylamine utilization protein [Pirellula sp.]
MKKLTLALLAAGTVALSAQSSFAQKWADLKMTIVLTGEIRKAETAKVTDPGCGVDSVLSEALVVNPSNKGIANVVFTLDTRKKKLKASDFHPDLAEIPSTKPVLDNVKCVFVPHVLTMRAGQTLEVKNSDTVSHNAKMAFFENKEVNPVIPANSSVEIKTELEERAPTPVECNVHPWMKAYVFVSSHPYTGVSDENGVLTISKLPAGMPLDFRIWHESQDKSIQEVVVGGKKQEWAKGVTTLELKEGVNDLGKIEIDVSRFRK